MSTVRGVYSSSTRSTAPAPWIALRPNQLRAECDRTPLVVTRTRIVPWQPASTRPSVGSPSTARSAASQPGSSRSMRPSPLCTASISSQS